MILRDKESLTQGVVPTIIFSYGPLQWIMKKSRYFSPVCYYLLFYTSIKHLIFRDTFEFTETRSVSTFSLSVDDLWVITKTLLLLVLMRYSYTTLSKWVIEFHSYWLCWNSHRTRTCYKYNSGPNIHFRTSRLHLRVCNRTTHSTFLVTVS